MRRRSSLVLVLGFVLGAPGGAVHADSRSVDAPAYLISYDDISERQLQDFVSDLNKALAYVALEIGHPPSGRLRINIDDDYSIRPRIRRDRLEIDIPADRIRGDFRRGPRFLHGRGPGVVHVLVEATLPQQNARWGNFLAEGIGAYLQDRFEREQGIKGNSYPNMGRPLHAETARVALRQRRFIRFSTILDIQSRDLIGEIRRQSLLQKASFVRFLVERNGRERLYQVVEGASFRQAYGKEACVLEREWLEFMIKGFPKVEAIARKRGDPCRAG